MNLVFMNSLEKQTEDNSASTGQVSIHEEHGTWYVLWNEPNEDGKMKQDHWFEGRSWDELLQTFRYRLAEKMAEGYVPLLGGLFDGEESTSDRQVFTQMLDYYSSMQEDDTVYQQLRSWRNEQAAKEKIPPYLIASNRTLKMIGTYLPYTNEELTQIPGLGVKKCELYSNGMLAITKKIVRQTSFPLDWVIEQIDQQQFQQWKYKQKEMKYKMDMEKHNNRKALLEGIQKGDSLEQLESELSISRRDLVFWIEQLDKEGYDLDTFISSELNEVSEKDRTLAMKSFDELGVKYLKPVLNQMYSAEEIKEKDIELLYAWLRLMRIQYRKQLEEQSDAS